MAKEANAHTPSAVRLDPFRACSFRKQAAHDFETEIRRLTPVRTSDHKTGTGTGAGPGTVQNAFPSLQEPLGPPLEQPHGELLASISEARSPRANLAKAPHPEPLIAGSRVGAWVRILVRAQYGTGIVLCRGFRFRTLRFGRVEAFVICLVVGVRRVPARVVSATFGRFWGLGVGVGGGG